jgi:antitoxin (DNA-binding transcriptional repressor) of toxin-antitoxin stability system
MKTLELRKASKALADYAANLGSESIVVTANNRPVAALVPLKNVDRESLPLSLDPAFMKIIRRARAEVRRGQVYSLEEVKREMLAEAGSPNPTLRRTRRRAARR